MSVANRNLFSHFKERLQGRKITIRNAGSFRYLFNALVGKTRLLEVLVSQDIRRGDVVIVFDPKGDGDLLRRIVFEANGCGREEDVLIFHFINRFNAIFYTLMICCCPIVSIGYRVSMRRGKIR